MIKLLKFIRKVNAKYLVILLLVVALSAFLRFYKLDWRAGFDADSEEIAFRALGILNGHPALLGPKTSVGGFAIGPLFSYLWAFFDLLFGTDPIVGSYLAVAVGVATTIAVYFAGKLFFDKKLGVILSLIWGVSLSRVLADQGPWAPSIFYLAEIIFLAGAYIAVKKPYGLIISAFGFALGFNSHFGIFLSALSLFAFWIFYRPQTDVKSIFASAGIIFMGALPNLIFDLRHNFENFKRLFLIFEKNTNAMPPDTLKIFRTVAELNISTFHIYPPIIISVAVFLFILFFGLWYLNKDAKNKALLTLLIVSIVVPCAVFIFYRSTFSEYYLMMTIPPFLFLVGYMIKRLIEGGKITLVLLFVVIFSIINIKSNLSYVRVRSLAAKKSAVEFVVNHGGKSGYGVSLSTGLGWNYGYNYLFQFYGASPDIPPKKGEKKIFTIVVPPGFAGITARKDFGGIGVLWEGYEIKDY